MENTVKIIIANDGKQKHSSAEASLQVDHLTVISVYRENEESAKAALFPLVSEFIDKIKTAQKELE